MINIVYSGKNIGFLEAEAVERLKHILTIKQLTYIEDLEHNNLILLPALEGKTIIIKTLADDEELLLLAQQLKEKLEKSGANIIIDQENKVKRGILKLLDDQIVFCLNKSASKEEKVLFYTSLFRGSHCNHIVKNLIRQFIKIASSKVNINLANFLQILINVRYWPYLIFTPLPTILIEFSSTEVIKSLGPNLAEWLINSFINCYGRTYSTDDNLLISQLLEEVTMSFQEQKRHKEEQLKQIEEINENLKELLENIKLNQESLSNKDVALEKPPSSKSEEKSKTVKVKPKTKASFSNKSRPSFSTLLLNPGKYPLAALIDGPVYQFTRPSSSNAVPMPVAITTQKYTKINSYHPGLVSKSLFYEYTKSNTKANQTEDSKQPEDKKVHLINKEESIHNKENLAKESKKIEENFAEKEDHSSNFATILQDFKQPALAIEEQNLTSSNK